jgi:hypothetical protein
MAEVSKQLPLENVSATGIPKTIVSFGAAVAIAARNEHPLPVQTELPGSAVVTTRIADPCNVRTCKQGKCYIDVNATRAAVTAPDFMFFSGASNHD